MLLAYGSLAMWSWWDCMQWWSATQDSSTLWVMFLPMMLWPILVIGGVIAFVVLLMRGARREATPTWQPNTGRQRPFDILRERFARGEIDRQEYEERRGLLSRP